LDYLDPGDYKKSFQASVRFEVLDGQNAGVTSIFRNNARSIFLDDLEVEVLVHRDDYRRDSWNLTEVVSKA
jgi:hypothetical protein